MTFLWKLKMALLVNLILGLFVHIYFLLHTSFAPPKQMAILSLGNLIIVVLFYFREKPETKLLFGNLLLLTGITQLFGLVIWVAFAYCTLYLYPAVYKGIAPQLWESVEFLFWFIPLSGTCISWGIKKLFFS